MKSSNHPPDSRQLEHIERRCLCGHGESEHWKDNSWDKVEHCLACSCEIFEIDNSRK